MPVEVEIGTLGRKVDSKGVVKDFNAKFFDEIVSSYNPDNFKAPAIISHDTKGIPDDKLHKNKELSYGAVSAVKKVGDRLKIVFNKLSPKIKQHFDNGELLSVSPSFYPPGHHANPTPGKWSLRHAAFLGSTPPAIKGMASPEFSETGYDPTEHTLDFSFPVELNESGETLEFSIASRSLKQILGSLRDWIVEKHGRDEAEKIMPSFALDEIAMSDRYEAEENQRLWREIDDLKSHINDSKPQAVRGSPMMYEEYETTDLNEGKTMKTKHKKTKPDVDPDLELDDDEEMDDEEMENDETPTLSKKKKKTMDLNEDTIDYAQQLAEERKAKQLLEFRIKAVEDKAERDRARQKEKDITNFCEGLVRDGYLAASQVGDRSLEFGEGEESILTLPQFMSGLDDEQLSFMEDFLASSPKVIELEEFAADDKKVAGNEIREFSSPDGYSISSDSAELYNQISEYAEENGLDMTNPDDLGKAYNAVA